MKQVLQLKIVQKQGVINGFSYLFCKGLVEKLKALKKEERLFKSEYKYALSEIGTTVVNALEDQLSKDHCTSVFASTDCAACTVEEIDEIILVAEEFLAIYE